MTDNLRSMLVALAEDLTNDARQHAQQPLKLDQLARLGLL